MATSNSSDKVPVQTTDKFLVPNLDVTSTPQPYNFPGIETMPQQQQRDRHRGPYYEPVNKTELTAQPDYSPLGNHTKVLGLSVKTFWIAIVALVVVLAAGIGGGIGGGLAVQNRRQASEASGAVSPPASGPGPSSLLQATRTTTSSTIPPIATDGCPSINGTIIVPTDANGVSYSRSNFLALCATKFDAPLESDQWDNMRVYVQTLDECIQLCAEYNYSYNNLRKNGVSITGSSVCRGVTLAKYSGGYCWLKNGTGPNTAYGTPDPSVYTSAILLH